VLGAFGALELVANAAFRIDEQTSPVPVHDDDVSVEVQLRGAA